MALTQVSTGGIKDGQVHTADLADAQITAGKLHADALDHTYTLGASGTNHYTFTGEGLTGAVNDPTLYLTRGKTYRFVNGNSSGAHPFRIQSVAGAGGTEYNTGVTNNAGAGGSTIIFEVPHDAPDVLYYICTSHAAMNGIFYVTGALADGTVTTAKLADNAVTSAKITDGAVSGVKIAQGGVTTSQIASGAVTSTEIADTTIVAGDIADATITLDKLAHGTSSNDGKFLRANNGADPTFETIAQPDLTQLSATNLTSGTVPDARFPATLPAVSGANLTNLPAATSTAGTNNFTISDGNLIVGTAGHGIDFSATANATMLSGATAQMGQGYDPSTDSELLTHYEHGTWKPRLRAYDHTGGAAWGHMVYSDGTVAEGSGRYVRIGRYVFASFGFSSGSKTFDSNWTYWSIDTIPFGANHYDRASGGLIVSHTNAFTDTTNIISGDIHGPDAYMIGNRPNGEYNATINSSNSGRWIRGWCSFYTSTG